MSLGHTDTLLSLRAMGHPWCEVSSFRGVGSPHDHDCEREGGMRSVVAGGMDTCASQEWDAEGGGQTQGLRAGRPPPHWS